MQTDHYTWINFFFFFKSTPPMGVFWPCVLQTHIVNTINNDDWRKTHSASLNSQWPPRWQTTWGSRPLRTRLLIPNRSGVNCSFPTPLMRGLWGTLIQFISHFPLPLGPGDLNLSLMDRLKRPSLLHANYYFEQSLLYCLKWFLKTRLEQLPF